MSDDELEVSLEEEEEEGEGEFSSGTRSPVIPTWESNLIDSPGSAWSDATWNPGVTASGSGSSVFSFLRQLREIDELVNFTQSVNSSVSYGSILSSTNRSDQSQHFSEEEEETRDEMSEQESPRSEPVDSDEGWRGSEQSPASLRQDDSDGEARGSEPSPASLQQEDHLPTDANEGTRRSHSPDSAGPPRKMARTCDAGAGARDDGAGAPDDGDCEACPICMDAWSSSGPHRVICLKCGHLFGQECVVRWLKSRPMKERVCPTCKAKAAVRDIRPVYARRLVAVDTSELDSARAQLEAARSDQARLELELHNTRTMATQTLNQLNKLRAEMQVQNASVLPNKASARRDRWHFNLEKTLEITAEQSCRVLAYNCKKYELYASFKSTVSLFPGYGVRKIDCANLKQGQFIPLHPKEIRDLDYTFHDDILLSVSLDRSAKLTCGRSNRAVGSAKADKQLWSCCWNSCVAGQFSLGCEGGVCLTYDWRNLSAPLARLSVASDRSPVISTAFAGRTLAACHLNSCRLYKIGSEGEHAAHELPIEGPFLSLRYHQEFKQLLISCRPSSTYKQARHVVASADLAAGTGCAVVDTLPGSRVQKLMSRSCHVPLDGALWVAAYSESDAAVLLYSTAQSRLMQTLKTQESVMDMLSLDISGEPVLATLSLNKVRLYKATLS